MDALAARSAGETRESRCSCIRYGDPAGIRGSGNHQGRLTEGDTRDSCVCDRDPDGRQGGGDRV